MGKKIPLGLGSVPSIHSLNNKPKGCKRFSDVGVIEGHSEEGKGHFMGPVEQLRPVWNVFLRTEVLNSQHI